MSHNWDDLEEWWSGELEDDPAYASDVHPILLDLVPHDPGVAMDLGCGEGQGMRLINGPVFGCDLSLRLLARSDADGRVVRTDLPDLRWLRGGSLDTAFSVYLVDLISDHDRFFSETARVVRQGGSLIVIINHPVYTSPGSAPLLDESHEVLWRWGTYFAQGSSTEPAGEGQVEFFHRPMADLLNSAANSGWMLSRMIERGLSDETIARIPSYIGQEQIPRLLGVHWVRSGPRGPR